MWCQAYAKSVERRCLTPLFSCSASFSDLAVCSWTLIVCVAMAPKKVESKAKATTGYAVAGSQPDTTSDELIAHIIAEMEKVSIHDVSKETMEGFAKMASLTVKGWNNRNKPTKEEKEEERKKKALQRSEEKKKATAEKRGRILTVQIEYEGQVYEVEVLASDTVADVRTSLSRR